MNEDEYPHKELTRQIIGAAMEVHSKCGSWQVRGCKEVPVEKSNSKNQNAKRQSKNQKGV